MAAPLEINLDFPVEVEGVRYEKLTTRTKVAAVRRKRGAQKSLAYLFDVPPAVVAEIDESDLVKITAQLNAYCDDLED